MSPMKDSLAKVYSWSQQLRNSLYDSGALDQVRISRPVISVGNLTLGGTGKTPVADLLLTHFARRGKQAALIARNYKAQTRGFQIVKRDQPQGAWLYGDEPFLLARKHPEIQVFVGPVKSETAQLAAKKNPADIYIVDDGFQHRALYRDLDLVLIDVSQGFANLEPFPLGRGRESIRGLKRAQALLLTKTEAVSSEDLEVWNRRLRVYFSGPIFHLRNRLQFPDLNGKKVFAFSGIGNPENFERPLKEQASRFEAFRFRDHHQYSKEDLIRIERRALDADLILTTEKDLIKIQTLGTIAKLSAVELKMDFVSGEEEFYALVDSVLG